MIIYMGIQSVIFNKHLYSRQDAMKWLRNRGYKDSYEGKSPYTQTINFWRFRQESPEKYKTYINKVISKGVILVIGI